VSEGKTLLLSYPKAAKEIGVELEVLRAWAARLNDPLPTVQTGNGEKRPRRKVVMPEVPDWLARQAEGETVQGGVR